MGWRDAVFEHYRVVEPAAVAAWLPDGLSLDLHDGTPWLSVVSFRMDQMRWRGEVRLPAAHTYPQINIRTYVHRDGLPGVFFLRNHVSNLLAAPAGARLYGMPYRHADVESLSGDGVLGYAAALPQGRLQRVVGRLGAPLTGHEDDPESLAFFLCERYPLFSVRDDRLQVAAMVHPPWPLHLLEVEARTHGAIEDLGLEAVVEPLPAVHGSPGVEVQMWGGEACEA